IGLQLAPEYLSGTLSGASLTQLARKHPNINILKVELSAFEAHHLVESSEGAFTVFNGKAGLDMPDSLKAGCIGFIPGAEIVDVLVSIYNGLTSADPASVSAAEDRYKEVMPLLSFLITSIDNFLVYGKTLMVRR